MKPKADDAKDDLQLVQQAMEVWMDDIDEIGVYFLKSCKVDGKLTLTTKSKLADLQDKLKEAVPKDALDVEVLLVALAICRGLLFSLHSQLQQVQGKAAQEVN